MAIDWDLQITDVNLSNGRATVTATRTDDQSALQPQVYTFPNTPLSQAADRASLLETIKGKVIEKATSDAQVVTFLDNLEQSGKAALETWETTRL